MASYRICDKCGAPIIRKRLEKYRRFNILSYENVEREGGISGAYVVQVCKTKGIDLCEKCEDELFGWAEGSIYVK